MATTMFDAICLLSSDTRHLYHENTMKISPKTHNAQGFLWNIWIFHRKSGGV